MSPEKNGEWTGSKRYRDPDTIPWEREVPLTLTRGQIIDALTFLDDANSSEVPVPEPDGVRERLDAAFADDTRKATSIIDMNNGIHPIQEPVRDDGYTHDDWREKHPAFGVIGASRVTAMPGAVLFGSDYRSQAYMTIRISEAELTRGLAHDRIAAAGRMPLVEVALTEAQWATFVSAPNIGDGTPCTLRTVNGEYVPGLPQPTDRREQLNAEVEKHVADAIASIDAVIGAGKTTAKDRRELEHARQTLVSGLPWVASSFDKHAEQVVEKMKIDVGAYMQNAIVRAGLEALGGVVPPIQLDDPTTSSLPSAEPALDRKDGSEAGSASR